MQGTEVKNRHDYRIFKNGDYIEGKYIYADGILTHISSSKRIGKYTFYKGKIKGKNVVFDGELYSHCRTMREGIRDLNFKRAKDRGADQYKDLKLDSEINFDEAVAMYRIITGACSQGTQSFIETLGETKERYTPREIITLTEGKYGNRDFKSFLKIMLDCNDYVQKAKQKPPSKCSIKQNDRAVSA